MELHKFIDHLKDNGLGDDGFSREMWMAIIDYFYKKDISKKTKYYEINRINRKKNR